MWKIDFARSQWHARPLHCKCVLTMDLQSHGGCPRQSICDQVFFSMERMLREYYIYEWLSDTPNFEFERCWMIIAANEDVWLA